MKKKYQPRIINALEWKYDITVRCCGEDFRVSNTAFLENTCPKCKKTFSMQLIDGTGRIVDFKKFNERLK